LSFFFFIFSSFTLSPLSSLSLHEPSRFSKPFPFSCLDQTLLISLQLFTQCRCFESSTKS
jgi:hypothetical protein